STNLFPLISTTSKLTEVPDCVSVTLPNPGDGIDPFSHVEPEIWHDVKVNVSASAGAATRPVRRSPAAPATIWKGLDLNTTHTPLKYAQNSTLREASPVPTLSRP